MPLDAQALERDAARPWSRFLRHAHEDGMGDWAQRSASLARQIRDNGVTYNVYADAQGPQRPWPVGLFPLLLTADDWQHIEAGVLQRMRLLEHIMADAYGPQQALAQGWLPAALVLGHPGYLRTLHGVQPAGGRFLHIAAFDLARGPDGQWWLVSQRTQAPSGLGYLLENRQAVSRLFPRAFEALQVQHLGGAYSALVHSLQRMAGGAGNAHIALLTPGPYNETYFEHAYLARHLGLSLVEGQDLTVRDCRLYLKTLRGLVPVHGLLKRVDDAYLDPLELRPDSTLGVPGLLQAVRAGNLLLANLPGSAFLESPALLGFLPGLCQQLLGETLQLPALHTWWCGEQAVVPDALAQLAQAAIKPSYPGSPLHAPFDTVLGHRLDAAARSQWEQRIASHGDEYTVQRFLAPSLLPSWHSDDTQPGAGALQQRAFLLRVFVLSDGEHGWRVLPGGMARLQSAQGEVAAMQQGGSSADVWVLGPGDAGSSGARVAPAMQRSTLVTSRAAENLFWLGRYTERADNAIRLARMTLECLTGEDPHSPALLNWLARMAQLNTLVPPGTAAPGPGAASRQAFANTLRTSLGLGGATTSVGYNLRALRLAAERVRERLSQEHWNLVQYSDDAFSQGSGASLSALDGLRLLKSASQRLSAMTGLQTDRMVRDDGWRLLSIGRHVERLGFQASALLLACESGALSDAATFDALLALADASMHFHAQYPQNRSLEALVDLLVLERDHPRALCWVAHTLQSRLQRLGEDAGERALTLLAPPTPGWPALLQGDAQALPELLQTLGDAACALTNAIAAQYFTHTGEAGQSLGA